MSVSESVGTNLSGGVGNTKTPPSSARNWIFVCNNFSRVNINEILDSKLISRYVFQEEVGESGTPHLQGYVEFHEKLRPRNKFSKRFHWELCNNTHGSIEYCSATGEHEGKQHGKQWTNISYLRLQVSCITELYHWQKIALKLILTKDNNRKIWWFYDKTGNIGKSAFCKYLCIHHDAIILSGKASDMKYGIQKVIEKGKTPKLVIMDIPRDSFDYVSYTGIEEIKNGCFFSNKYESGMCVFNSPTVVCFANKFPDHSTMSKDRWVNSIYDLEQARPFDTEEEEEINDNTFI